MASAPDGKPPGPDEIDRGIREILAGLGGESAVKEPSAAERASQRPGPDTGKRTGRRDARKARQLRQPASGGGKGLSWRRARRARQLRKPVLPPGQRPSAARRLKPRSAAGPPGARSLRRGRAASAVKWMVILVAFAGLLYGLHLLGFGPH